MNHFRFLVFADRLKLPGFFAGAKPLQKEAVESQADACGGHA
jgi:hypothetical protein